MGPLFNKPNQWCHLVASEGKNSDKDLLSHFDSWRNTAYHSFVHGMVCTSSRATLFCNIVTLFS